MTGFGNSELSNESISLSVEIRTVNHRFKHVSIKQSVGGFALEERIRKITNRFVQRGHVEILVSLKEFNPKGRKVSLDRGLVEGYLDAFGELEHIIGVNIDRATQFRMIAQLPDLFISEETPDEDATWSLLEDALIDAFQQVVEMRKSEGQKLHDDVTTCMGRLSHIVQQLTERAPHVTSGYRSRLNEKLQSLEVPLQVSSERIIQEVAIFAERADINEELARIGSHMKQFFDASQTDCPIGRTLDFLLQEIFRELNTIASKAHDAPLIAGVVDAKSEVEKMREQVQNIQ